MTNAKDVSVSASAKKASVPAAASAAPARAASGSHTAMIKKLIAEMTGYGEEMLEITRRATPLKRLGTPEEVARVILFLASDRNDFIIGAVFTVDGGQPLWGDIWPIPELEPPSGAA